MWNADQVVLRAKGGRVTQATATERQDFLFSPDKLEWLKRNPRFLTEPEVLTEGGIIVPEFEDLSYDELRQVVEGKLAVLLDEIYAERQAEVGQLVSLPPTKSNVDTGERE